MLQLLPSFSRLSLDSLSRRRAAPTGADVNRDKEAEDAGKLLVMLSRESAPGPSQPGSSQPASLTEAQRKERDKRLKQTPRAIAERMRRKAQREREEMEEREGNRQPTAKKKNSNLGNNVPWLDWETHRLWGALQDEMNMANGERLPNFKAILERFNNRLADGEKRSLDQIKGKARELMNKGLAASLPNSVRKPGGWTEKEDERLREIYYAVPKRADGRTDLNEIMRRYNQGLPEAYHRGKDSLKHKLVELKNSQVPAGART